MHSSLPDRIPFNRPAIVGSEFDYLSQAIRQSHISGDGTFTTRCNSILEETLPVKKALLTTSCTHALEMSALLLNICPGDEVIVPDFTFVSTVNAFVLRGAIPVFADIHSDTLNLDETKLDSLITSKTKAIVPVHYAGVSCEMNEILKIAKLNNLAVIEDNAHGLFGKYRGRALGSLGNLATLSFHETKNFSCGEGGALLINDEKFTQRAEVIREKGTNRSKFLRGEIDKYSWVDLGSSYLPSDLLAAFLFAQLNQRDQIQAKRKKIWEFYQTTLKSWASKNDFQLPTIPKHCEQTYHMFYIILPSLEIRQALIQHLQEKNIQAISHYIPLHLSSMGQKFKTNIKSCPVSTHISERLLRLPFFFNLSEPEQERVVSTILEFKNE